MTNSCKDFLFLLDNLWESMYIHNLQNSHFQPWNVFFCDLSVLVRKLACVFGHPPQVSTQIPRDYLWVCLARALQISCWSCLLHVHLPKSKVLSRHLHIGYQKQRLVTDDQYKGVCFLQVNPFRAISGFITFLQSSWLHSLEKMK